MRPSLEALRLKCFPADALSQPTPKSSPQASRLPSEKKIASRLTRRRIYHSALRKVAAKHKNWKLSLRAKQTHDTYLRESRKYERAARRERALRNARIIAEKRNMRAQLREKDTARQRRLYQNKTPVTILHTASDSENRLMRRLTQGQSVMAAPPL